MDMTDLASRATIRSTRETAQTGWTLAVTSIGFVIVQLDITVVNVALPQIAGEFATPTSALQWIIDAYSLAFATLLLTAGVAGDRFGSRRIFLAGLALFAVASLACGLAPSVSALIAARAAQGMGGALILPTSLALIAHACGDNEPARIRMIGWWSASGALAVAAGPVIGGLIISGLGWRPIFLVNLPLCVLGAWLTWSKVAETETHVDGRFDLAGLIAAALALFVLTGAVIEAGAWGWADPWVLAGFCGAAIIGLAFLKIEAATAKPMLPLGLLRSPGFSAAAFVGAVISLTFFGLVFVLSLYFQQIRGYSPAVAGLAFLPLTAIITLANVASGQLSARIGFRLPMVAGMLIAATGNGLLLFHRLDSNASFPIIAVGLLLISTGTGVAAPAMVAAALAKVERMRSGTASAVLTTARQVGGTMGIALFGAFVAGGTQMIPIGATLVFIVSAALLLLGAGIAWLGR
jgi:DHA2 family methylenomycin A resistance protein-like MFS transporter